MRLQTTDQQQRTIKRQAALTCSPVFNAVVLLLIGTMELLAQVPVLSFHEIKASPEIPNNKGFSLVRQSPNGRLFLVESDGWAIVSVAVDSAPRRFSLADIPEVANGSATQVFDLAVDATGRIYILAAWGASDLRQVGVFCLDSQGKYIRTTPLTPSKNLRHLTLSQNGDFVTLGTDPDFMKGLTPSAHLIHEYSAETGDLLRSYSEVSEKVRIPRNGDKDFVSLYPQAAGEIDDAILWREDKRIYQVFPRAHLLSIYDDGKLVERTEFVVPNTDALNLAFNRDIAAGSEYKVWRFFVLPRGFYLVQWVESKVVGGDIHNLPFMAVHDRTGKAVTRASLPPIKPSAPVATLADGSVLFLSGNMESARIVQVAIAW